MKKWILDLEEGTIRENDIPVLEGSFNTDLSKEALLLASTAPEMLEFINHVANTMPEGSSLQVKAKKLLNNYTMETSEQKIKCFTMSDGNSTLYATDVKAITIQLEGELNENLKDDDEPMEFHFGIKYLTQSEINALGEFDGF